MFRFGLLLFRYRFWQHKTLLLLIFIGNHIIMSAQIEFPDYPKCEKIISKTQVSFDSLIRLSDVQFKTHPQHSFCYLLAAKNKDIKEADQIKLALKLQEKSQQLFKDAKYKEANYFASLSGKTWMQLDSLSQLSLRLIDISDNYYYLGDLYNAIIYANAALNLSKKHQLHKEQYKSVNALAWCYWKINNFKKAKKYIDISKNMIDNRVVKADLINYYNAMANLYNKKKSYHLAIKYNDSAIALSQRLHNDKMYALCISNKAYFLTKTNGNFDSILDMTLRAISINKKMQDKEQLSSNLALLAEVYLYHKDFDKTIEAAQKALKISRQIDRKPNEIMDYSYLKEAYFHKKNYKKAYEYAQKHNSLYKELYGPLNIIKIFEIQQKNADAYHKSIIENLKKEKEIVEIKKHKDKAIFAYSVVILSLIFMGILSYFIYAKNNQRRHNKAIQKRLQFNSLKMEMEALRAKMNPHFLFNSLNSINSFIAQNDAKSASKYLTKFATLVRLILKHSKYKLISLADDLKALKFYVDLEKVRLGDKFDFYMEITPEIDLNEVMIPPSIIQPFLENAIWHGLVTLKKRGVLRLKVSSKEDWVYIEITDNGIGRKKAEAIKSKKHQSVGTNIINKTMQVFKDSDEIALQIETIDLYNVDNQAAGTKAIIKLKNK